MKRPNVYLDGNAFAGNIVPFTCNRYVATDTLSIGSLMKEAQIAASCGVMFSEFCEHVQGLVVSHQRRLVKNYLIRQGIYLVFPEVFDERWKD